MRALSGSLSLETVQVLLHTIITQHAVSVSQCFTVH